MPEEDVPFLFAKRYGEASTVEDQRTMRCPVSTTLISGGLLLAVKTSGAFAFMPPPERSECLQRRSGQRYRRTRAHVPAADALTLGGGLMATSSDEDEDDDDGWGSPSSSKVDQERELAALQAERSSASSQSRSVRQAIDEPPERDLFIPIFALVSLAGLFGSYGYEMLRLYSRGELYLPWNQ